MFLHNRTLYDNKNGPSIATCNKMDKSHKYNRPVWFHLYKFQKQANQSIRNQDGGCLRCKGVAFGKRHSGRSWAAWDAVFLNLDAASMSMRSSLCETQTEPHIYDVYIFI